MPCAPWFGVWAPGPFLSFMNSLFHGMDFSGMAQARPFSWPDFVSAALVLSLWALFGATFFAWLHNWLRR